MKKKHFVQYNLRLLTAVNISETKKLSIRISLKKSVLNSVMKTLKEHSESHECTGIADKTADDAKNLTYWFLS